MTADLVTAEDLRHGWFCEHCDRPFQVGDVRPAGRLIGHHEDGLPVFSEYVCQACDLDLRAHLEAVADVLKDWASY